MKKTKITGKEYSKEEIDLMKSYRWIYVILMILLCGYFLSYLTGDFEPYRMSLFLVFLIGVGFVVVSDGNIKVKKE